MVAEFCRDSEKQVLVHNELLEVFLLHNKVFITKEKIKYSFVHLDLFRIKVI